MVQVTGGIRRIIIIVVSAANLLVNGGADGTRTRDLRRDRPAF